MTLRLDTPLDIGGWRVAAVSETRVMHQRLGAAVFGEAMKAPVAVVFCKGPDLHATDMTGRALDIETLEDACPGLIASMTERS